jgi:Zn-dependent protease/CBS domain-containing protein
MKWRWRLGEWLGIVVYMHATFLLLIGWVALSHFLAGEGLAEALNGILFILLLFACVVMHEYGHALTARRYGIQTRDITLLPIGGVARLERMPRDPRQELWVALAGPAVNVAIAAALFVLIELFEGAAALTMTNVQLVGGDLLPKLMWINLSLAVFNLLPAFPMDGGRVLRALLARRMDYAHATRAAASVGQMMAFLFALWGLYIHYPFMLFIALFVYLGAEAEAQAVQVQSAFSGLPVSRAMLTRFATLDETETLGRAVQLLLSSTQQDFPVTSAGEGEATVAPRVAPPVVGLLTRRDLLSALHESGPAAPISSAVRRDVEPVEARAPLEEIFQRMQVEELPAVPVTEGGRLVGMITMENIAEFLMVRAALEGAPQEPGQVTERDAAVAERPAWRPRRGEQL